jgi:hypothetical protein
VSGSLFDFALYMFHNAKDFWHANPGPIFICQSWRAILKLVSGTMFSISLKIR